MSSYANQDLAITVLYPKEFVPQPPQDLQTVMELGHRLVFGDDPKGDPEHAEAVRCMHTLLYATACSVDDGKTSTNADNSLTDTILVEDVDPSCMPKKPKGDKALSNLVGTVLHLPNSEQLVPQIWFVAGGNRLIHSGMAGTMLTLTPAEANKAQSPRPVSVPMFVLAAAVEQKGHRVLILYLSGTSGEKHETVSHLSIAFEDGRPVLLFPFLLGNMNLIK